MTSTVSLPLWLAVLLVALAAWAALDRLLLPGVRFFLRRRVNRVIDELNTRLRIRIQPFKLTKRRVLIDRLLYDPEVIAAVDAHSREQRMPREVAMAQVERYAGEIVPAFNAYLYFRLGYRVSRAVARVLYRVRLGYSDEEALAAVDPEATVVFVMNHRSNMDYVLVSYLAATSTALSYAVGEWARIWPLQTLIRSLGAYFVRRRSKNPLYRRVLERYVHMATASGVTQAIYPEGGLSRDGTLQPPKLGLFDYMLRDFDPAHDRDVAFVPVGINYDRVLEDRTLLRDLDPGAGKVGGGAAALTTLRFLGRNLRLALVNRWYRFGYACVNFGTPVSAKAWLAERGVDLRRLPREERFAEIQRLADRLMAAVGRAVPAVPAALVATVFVRRAAELAAADPAAELEVAANPAATGSGAAELQLAAPTAEDRAAAGAPVPVPGAQKIRPLSALEIKARVFELSEALQTAGAHVYVPRGDQDYAIDVGLRMLTLRHLIDEQGGLYTPRSEELPVLRYYANSIEHLVVQHREA
jgi:glycerol-3-phosphate O-acyltransferase